jgi:large-conductance mechanosensitive channel
MRVFWSPVRISPFLVLLLASLAAHISAEGPRATSFEYVVKSYQDLESSVELAVLSASFDQDIFFNFYCNSTEPSAEFGCNSPNCIDESATLTDALGESETKTYSFTVQNPNSCYSVALLVSAIEGDPDVYFSFRASNPVPSRRDNDLSLITIGSDALITCCADIRNLFEGAETWNGDVYFTIASANPTRYQISLTSDTRLNATEIYWKTPLEVDCPASGSNQRYYLSPEQCNGGYCNFLPPTRDPFFSRVATITGLETTIDLLPRRMSVSLVISSTSFTSTTTSATSFYFPKGALSYSGCSYRFPALVNSNDEPMVWSKITQKQLTCSKNDFSLASQGLDDVVTSLNNLTTTSLLTVSEYIFRSVAWTVSDEWVACRMMIEGQLAQPQTEERTFTDTQACLLTDPSSAEFQTDPCCNATIQLRTCCAPRTVTANINTFAPNATAISNMCVSPRCSSTAVADYIVLNEAAGTTATGCSTATINALNDETFVSNPLSGCKARVYQTVCSTNSKCMSTIGHPDTLCLGVGYCTAPCETDEDCLTGQCITVQESKTCLLYDQFNETADLTTANTLLLQCLNNDTDGFVRVFFRQELGLNTSSTEEEFRDRFFSELPADTCTSIFTVASDDPRRTNQTLCEETRMCNWAFCNDFDTPQCTSANCNDNVIITNPDYCQTCFGQNSCFETSSFGHCEYLTSSEADCTSQELPHFNPIGRRYDSLTTGVCYRTGGQCLPTDKCTSAEIADTVCAAKCFFPSLTLQSSCEGAGHQWSTALSCYDTSLATRSACETASGTWWAGTALVASYLNNQAECEAIGACYYDDTIEFTNETACINSFFCENAGTETTQPTCEAAGICSDTDGCYYPFFPTGNCAADEVWTPIGCYSESSNAATCNVYGGTMHISATTKEECLSRGQVCFEPQVSGSLRPEQRQNFPPRGITLKDSGQCSACNGERVSLFTWTAARWIRKQWTPNKWTARGFIQANDWLPSVDTNYDNTYNTARMRRYSNIIKSNILCRFSQVRSVIDQLACGCGSGATGNTCGTESIVSQVVQVAQVCNSVPTLVNFGQGSLNVSSSVSVVDSDCTEIPISLVPLSQFTLRKQVTLSSVSVSLSQSGRAEQVQFILNSGGVAVGELLGDGVQYSPNGIILNGLTPCYTFPIIFNSSLNIASLDLAYPTDDTYSRFVPLGLNLPLGTYQYCFSENTNVTSTVAYFPLGLIANWETATFIEGLYAWEIFIIYFGVVCYLVVLGLCLTQLTFHAIDWAQSAREKGFFSLGRIALLLLGVALLDRVLYLLLLPVGEIEKSKPLDAIFSELPALLYSVIFSIIVLRWAEIFHFTISSSGNSGFSKLKPAVIAIDVFLGAAFIAILIAFLVIPVQVLTVDCNTPDEAFTQLTDTEAVAVAYKTFFAAVCLTLGVCFIVYSTRIIQIMSKKNNVKREEAAIKKRERALIRLIITSAVCTFCLLGQAANLLWSSIDSSSRNIVGVLIFLYIIELGPAVMFIIMFKRTSMFARYTRRGGFSTRRSTAQGSSTLKSGQSATASVSATSGVELEDK